MANKVKGCPIVKKLNGQVVATYTNIKEARETEKIGYTKMRAALDHGTIIDGYRYEFVVPEKKPKKQRPQEATPWEKGGMFDIKGWGTLALFA